MNQKENEDYAIVRY